MHYLDALKSHFARAQFVCTILVIMYKSVHIIMHSYDSVSSNTQNA